MNPEQPAARAHAGFTLAVAGLFGALAVAAGAFGAHGLRARVSPGDLEIWRTAAHYQLVHAAVLAALGLASARGRKLRVAAVLLVVGMVVFSGTLYAMVLGGPRILGAITPLGGACLIAAWVVLLLAGLARRTQP